jgi:predicted ArsR family transcriptional regulator
MKPTTRLRILDYIRKYQAASVKELSQILGMTGANIRHHLSLLESNDLIEVVAHRQEGRGRPMQVYGLSRRVLGDGLDELAGALLEVWLGAATDKGMDAGLKSVAEKLSGVPDTGIPVTGTSVMQRLARTIERLNELRYQARWEASVTGARLILGHCPYSAIITRHPELCRMDAILLELRLDSPFTQTTKLQVNDKGLSFCSFVMVGD